jgi:glutamate-ammonia-ligase adenylyltransferase
MRQTVWQKAIKNSADPERVQKHLEKLQSSGAGDFLARATTEQAAVLAALFSGSQAMSDLLPGHPDWLDAVRWDLENLKHARQKQGLLREIEQAIQPWLAAKDYGAALAWLREFRQREMLRIAARDLGRLAVVENITLEISNLADVCLETVWRITSRQLEDRYGLPYHQDTDGAWVRTSFSVIGLGKLGGQELNYSSDVDVVFAYSDEGSVFRTPPTGKTPGGQVITNHQYFIRLAEAFVAEVGRATPQGILFRIDLRLRPEGPAGPLARSLGSYENYYAQWGQTWERMMLIKARGVAGSSVLAGEFIEMVQPFRFARSHGERTVGEVAAMKQRIETELLKGDELDRNVKLGRGGIREIEFVVQTLQLLHAGRMPFLQIPKTLPVLEKLVEYRLLQAGEANVLGEAYRFLRDVEHRLQMEANLQTHLLPIDKKARMRLAALMGYSGLEAFEEQMARHRQTVRRIFEKLLNTEAAPTGQGLPAQFQGAKAEWLALLAGHGFRDGDKAYRLLETFVHGPGYVHVSSRTVELAKDLVARLLRKCPRKTEAAPAPVPGGPAGAAAENAARLSDPDRVLARLDSFIQAYGARSTLFEMWAGNPSLFDLMVLLFDRSEFLAEIAIRVPDLVDDLALSGRLRRAKKAEETLRDLRHGSEDEDQRLWLRRYHQAEFMRIGLREILGLADFEQNVVELTGLADACLQYSLEAALRELGRKTCPLAIIGLGKLGGTELTYGSDLDLIFVADPKVRNLSALQAVAAKVMDLLSSPTELGVAFVTDARLRPDGAKGLLVNSLKAYEDYYRQRAMLWEIQTLTRARPVAGNIQLGERFMQMARTLCNFQAPALPLAAYRPDWKQEIARMRLRIERERVPAGKQALAFKTGAGGLMDAEFIAQTLCLEHGWHEPNTLAALERAQAVLPKPEGGLLLENYRRLWHIEGILRRWSYAGESELPDDPAPQYRVAVRCGFNNAGELLAAVAEYRKQIRAVYAELFSSRAGA